jgi:hypothetical protein
VSILRIYTHSVNIFALSAARGVKASGVLYMHRITDRRMVESPLVPLKLFEILYGSDFPQKILLVTTMWDIVDANIGATRERDLREHFKTITRRGFDTYRFGNNTKSAWGAVQCLLNQ